jgi:hypothetical protein
MPPQHPWIWKAYAAIYSLLIARKLYDLLSPDSPVFLYYFILRAFDPALILVYGTYVARVLFTTVHCVPLLLYVHGIRFLSPDVWRTIFILRCVFEFTGYSYESNILLAVYRIGLPYFLLTAATYITPNIPSYIACYNYAFRNSRQST